jgi:hypothetical protein
MWLTLFVEIYIFLMVQTFFPLIHYSGIPGSQFLQHEAVMELEGRTPY